MTFPEALLAVLSFFWSPLIVVLLMGVISLVGIGVCFTGMDYREPWLVITGGAVGLVAGVFAISLCIYLVSNGIGPLNWVMSS